MNAPDVTTRKTIFQTFLNWHRQLIWAFSVCFNFYREYSSLTEIIGYDRQFGLAGYQLCNDYIYRLATSTVSIDTDSRFDQIDSKWRDSLLICSGDIHKTQARISAYVQVWCHQSGTTRTKFYLNVRCFD